MLVAVQNVRHRNRRSGIPTRAQFGNGGRNPAQGPDDIGGFEDADNGVALEHTRLKIDGSPLGYPPNAVGAWGLVLLFNGEIYTYRELREYSNGGAGTLVQRRAAAL